MAHGMAKTADKRAAGVNRASLPESPAALREPVKPRRKSPGRAKRAKELSTAIIGQDVKVEIKITNVEPTYEQRAAYDRFWQLFFQRIITGRSSKSDENIAKPEE
jgi:hypothetical protein